MTTSKKMIAKAIGLGAVAGMRATVAPTVLSFFLNRHPSKTLAKSGLSFIQSPVTALITKVLTGAEFVGDKLPNGPNRIIFPQVAVRVASGALAGAGLFRSNKAGIAKGLVLGGASALAVTFGSYYLRKYIDKKFHAKDSVVGGIEDLISLASGWAVMRK
jgi:uncharacterized membrane protein